MTTTEVTDIPLPPLDLTHQKRQFDVLHIDPPYGLGKHSTSESALGPSTEAGASAGEPQGDDHKGAWDTEGWTSDELLAVITSYRDAYMNPEAWVAIVWSHAR